MGKEHHYKVRQGGLMRCCLASLDAYMLAATTPPQDGDKIRCRSHGGKGMIFRDGAWELAEARCLTNSPEKKL